MKAGVAFCISVGVTALAAVGASAQTAGAPATAPAPSQSTPPQTETVGPRELRDFSLGGTPARTSAPPAQTQETPPAAQPPVSSSTVTDRSAPAAPSSSSTPRTTASPPATARAAPSATAKSNDKIAVESVSEPQVGPPPAPVLLDSLPVTAATEVPGETSEPDPTGAFLLWPWLLGGLAMLVGAAVMMFRQRPHRAIAGHSAGDAFGPREPTATPTSPPQMRRAQPAQPAARRPPASATPGGGLVSTRLRPWIDVEFVPGRCILEDDRVTVEFLIKVSNAGNANARDLRMETVLFNAGPSQEDEVGAFFAHPQGRGEALDSLPPLKAVELRSSVSLPNDRLQVLQAGGRQLFVPLIGFNILYRWSNGEGQSSLCFLLGREGEGAKMAPFRTDLGPRVFRGVGARQLDLKVRR